MYIEAPQNAPQGGSYLLIVYPGEYGPLILDCMWQPQSIASRQADTLLLFEKVVIPIEKSVPVPPAQPRLERAVAQTRYFWMMATIVAKYIARHDTWEVLRLLSSLSYTVAEIEWLAGRRSSPPDYRHRPEFAPPLDVAKQVKALRDLMAKVSDVAVSAALPAEAIPMQVLGQMDALFSLVETLG